MRYEVEIPDSWVVVSPYILPIMVIGGIILMIISVVFIRCRECGVQVFGIGFFATLLGSIGLIAGVLL
jgi:hypothetical protein